MSIVRHALISTMGIQIVATASTVVLSTIAPMVALQLGVESSLIGTYVCCMYAAGSFAAVIGGIMVTRYGGIHVSQACLALAAIGLTLSCSGNLWIMALGAVFIGCSYGPITPSSSDILAHTVPRDKMGMVFSFKQTAVPLGSGLVGFVIPGFALWANDWRAGPMLVAALCLVGIAFAMYHRKDLDDHTRPDARFSIQTLLNSLRLAVKHPQLRRLSVVGSVFNGAQMCTLSYLVAYLVEDVTLSIVFAGLALSTASAGGMIGRLFWGVFADFIRAPKLTLVILGYLMSACSVGMTFFTELSPQWAILAVVFSLGASAIGWNGVLLAEIAREAPEGQTGVATGGMIFFGYIVAISMTMLFAGLHTAFGQYHAGFIMVAALCTTVATWLLVSKSRPNRH